MPENHGDERVKRAAELAAGYERTCTNCAQSAVAGLLDAFSLRNDDLFRSASGLADGIGLSGDGSCGALVGCSLVIGLLFGRERKDHADIMKPMQSYLLCKELHADFIEQYGSCRCADIQTRLMGRWFDLLNPDDFEAALQAGVLEHCSGVVGRAATRAAEIIVREQEAAASRG
jgi:C_GCAxxG_C_C family probable redox protein